MNYDPAILVNLAAVAGIFIGFGSLITVAPTDDEERLSMLRAVVVAAMIAMIGTLIPVLLSYYGIQNNDLWRWSSGILFALIWLAILHPRNRPTLSAMYRFDKKAFFFFWLVIEPPIQIPLALCILGYFPSLHPAFYITAIVLNILQSGYLLIQLVYAVKSQGTK